MTKIILILTAVAAGAASYKAWGNKQAFAALKAEVESLEQEATNLKNKYNRVDSEFTDTSDELEKQGAARDEEKFRVELSRDKLKSRTNAITETQSEVNAMNGEIDQMKAILANSGVEDPEALQAALVEATDRNTELTTLIDEQTTNLETAQARVNERRAVLANLRKTVQEESAQFNVKTRRATVSAVDPEWNFAVINMGNTEGIGVNDRVIVERGGQRIGMLVVDKVERSQITANIVPEAGGGDVQPGDSVVFDKKKEES